MTKEDKEKIKIKIEITNQIKQLKIDIKRLKELTKPIPLDKAIGRITRMEAINEKSLNESTLRNAKQNLIILENLINTVDDDKFGICIICDNPIPVKRILRVPESNRCIGCIGK